MNVKRESNTNINISEIFGEDVFSDNVMQERLPKKVYRELRKTIDEGKDLDPMTAEVVANAMRDWAIEKGATHYTHWFQPLTGITAEKHDSFIAPGVNGGAVVEFSGKELIKSEPDASSFPSGGIRSTFEARGYTAWDCTSPAFVRHDAAGAILCIPTAFCSYSGESLDMKTPLLRSIEALNTEALRLIRLFGNKTSKRVRPSVGAEQEYFLVDRDKFLKRKDLIYTGHTLFGAMPPKGQELDDQYFGAIRERVAEFMKTINVELWKLGVTAKTQHNEAAPGQHELAPIYNDCNVAVDHNQLVMEVMKKVAERQGMMCLLHEKPFAGVNGSGKHDNWSLITDDGINLLDPGKTPHDNVQFLLILTCLLKAVDNHAGLLRESAATLGNDYRLGGSEAPPAIVSVFLGEQLQDVISQLISTGMATSSLKREKLETGVSTLPSITKDATDRNRTSPFAFTGNKFEFRMVGSSASIAEPNIVLNSIAAEAFAEASDYLEGCDDFEIAVHDLIKKYATEHQRIIFNGNGYSEEWVKEAERRGLPNLRTVPDAIPALSSESSVRLFGRFGIFTEAELISREEIKYEEYAKEVNIEARTMIDMASKSIIPACIRCVRDLSETVTAVKTAGYGSRAAQENLRKITALTDEAYSALEKLISDDEKSLAMPEGRERAIFCRDTVKEDMESLRAPIDKLEMMVGKDYWPMPSYGDLLFEV